MNILTLHLVLLIITAPAILYADHMGFQYMTGRILTVNAKKVAWVHWTVSLGLLLLVITGILVTIPLWAIMLKNPLFYAKLALVVTLTINGFFINTLMKKATTTAYVNLSDSEKKFLIVSGAVSACGWIATIVIGFFGL